MQLLISKLVRGEISHDEKAELAEYYVPLAKGVAGKFKNSEDYLGPALFGIVYALNNPRMEMNTWVMSCISRCVRNHLTQNHIIKVPYSTIRNNRKRGIEMQTIKVRAIYGIEIKSHNSRHCDKILEALDDVSQDEMDREIIQLRLDGYRDCEIGDMLGKSKSFINNRRNSLETRYDSRMTS